MVRQAQVPEWVPLDASSEQRWNEFLSSQGPTDPNHEFPDFIPFEPTADDVQAWQSKQRNRGLSAQEEDTDFGREGSIVDSIEEMYPPEPGELPTSSFVQSPLFASSSTPAEPKTPPPRPPSTKSSVNSGTPANFSRSHATARKYLGATLYAHRLLRCAVSLRLTTLNFAHLVAAATSKRVTTLIQRAIGGRLCINTRINYIIRKSHLNRSPRNSPTASSSVGIEFHTNLDADLILLYLTTPEILVAVDN